LSLVLKEDLEFLHQIKCIEEMVISKRKQDNNIISLKEKMMSQRNSTIGEYPSAWEDFFGLSQERQNYSIQFRQFRDTQENLCEEISKLDKQIKELHQKIKISPTTMNNYNDLTHTEERIVQH
jgi:predicted  nucleic acid-binding Zn-ribbon protein